MLPRGCVPILGLFGSMTPTSESWRSIFIVPTSLKMTTLVLHRHQQYCNWCEVMIPIMYNSQFFKHYLGRPISPRCLRACGQQSCIATATLLSLCSCWLRRRRWGRRGEIDGGRQKEGHWNSGLAMVGSWVPWASPTTANEDVVAKVIKSPQEKKTTVVQQWTRMNSII